MDIRLTAVMLVGVFLAACASHDGTYSPACAAYAGSVIELERGEFEWTKFTDQVIVDDHGERVDQFPSYPMRGTYRIDGQSVLMTSSDGHALDPMYLHEQNGETYLYSAAEYDALKATGEPAKCPLKLGRDANEK